MRRPDLIDNGVCKTFLVDHREQYRHQYRQISREALEILDSITGISKTFLGENFSRDGRIT